MFSQDQARTLAAAKVPVEKSKNTNTSGVKRAQRMTGSSTTQVSELKLEVATGRWSAKSHGLLLGTVVLKRALL